MMSKRVKRRGNRRRLIPVAIVFFGIGQCVFAQTDQPSSRSDEGGWVVAAFIGGAHTFSSDLTISQPALGNNLNFERVRFNSRSFDSPLYYGFRGGYFIRRMPFLGIEAEFIHLKVFSDPQQQVRVTGQHRSVAIDRELPLGEIVEQYSVSHGVNLLLFNIAGRRRIDRLILTARAGLGPTLPHTESRIEGQGQEQYEVGSFGWQAAGGVEFKLWRGLYVLGEYKFTEHEAARQGVFRNCGISNSNTAWSVWAELSLLNITPPNTPRMTDNSLFKQASIPDDRRPFHFGLCSHGSFDGPNS